MVTGGRADGTMTSPNEGRCREARQWAAVDAAFKAGDLDALRAAVGDPTLVPNGPMPLAIGPCLVYAVYHSPLAFIRQLLDLGADPDGSDNDGFPPVIAALSCLRARPGSPGRSDVAAMVDLLLEYGADPDGRGLNDWTPLHMAVAQESANLVRLLLARGADPGLRTRIDDHDTPREFAATMGAREIEAILAAAEARR
jgi:ankyrin repeat protein